MPRILRYLCIAVTALSLAACLLLIALWVRSYWIFSEAKWVSASRTIDIRSYRGGFGAAIYYPNSPNPVFETTYGRWWGIGTWHTFEKGWQAGTYFFWPVLVSLFCAAAPWFPWSKRFGLRTLLIAMTLAAAVLGVITYVINSLIPLILTSVRPSSAPIMHDVPMPGKIQPATDTRKRRWLRFGLRTLLVLVTLLCVWLGWLMHGVQKQRRAVARLEKHGARLVYFPWFTMPPWNDILPPSARASLNAALPSDDWRRLTSVTVENVDFRDEDLNTLGNLPHLSRLRLPGTPLTDAGLRRLASLKAGKLILLDLRNTQITDAGLDQVAKLKGLEWLFLAGTEISDTGLEHVAKLIDLEYLSLDDTQVTDAGIAHLLSLQKLDELSLDGTRVTGACLEHLSAIKSLRVLDLRETQVQGEGLAQLAKLPKLELLVLNDTPISNADLAYLRRLSHVAKIWVAGTQLKAEAIQQLPNARTNVDQPPR